MAEILLFPTERLVDVAHRAPAGHPKVAEPAIEAEADDWAEEDVSGSTSFEEVTSLAATPSQTLAVLVRKVEVLVARLASDDGSDAGLCMAEARLLKSVLHDVQAFAADVVFAVQGAKAWQADPIG